MDFPEVRTEEDVMKLVGTGKGGNDVDDEICDPLLHNSHKGSVEQQVKYIQDPAPYLDGLAMCGEYYGNLKHDVARMRRGFY